MFGMIIANIVGIFLLIFLFWYKLKEDYHYEKVFNLVIFVLLGLFSAFIFSRYLFKDYWFYIYLLGSFLGFSLGVFKLKMKFFESLDAFTISFLPYLGFFFLTESVLQFSLYYFLGFWIIALFIFLYSLLDANYRKFTWYRSGRVGFSGLLILGLLFLTRALIAYFFNWAPSIAGAYDIYISASFSFVSFLLLFNLSRKVS